MIEDVSASVPAAEGGAVPAFVYPNLGDHGYAKFTLDEASVAYAAEHLGSLGDGLLRQQVWASLYEMVRDGALTSLRYLELVDRHLPAETSLPVVDMVTATVAGVIGRFVPEERLNASASAFVATATRAIAAAPPGDARVLWARALIAVAITPGGRHRGSTTRRSTTGWSRRRSGHALVGSGAVGFTRDGGERCSARCRA